MATWAELENAEGEVLVDRGVVPESQKIEGKHKFVVTGFTAGVSKAGNAQFILEASISDETKTANIKDWFDPDPAGRFYWKLQNLIKSLGGDSKQTLKRDQDGVTVLMKTGSGYVSPLGLSFIADVKTETTDEGYVNIRPKNYYTK